MKNKTLIIGPIPPAIGGIATIVGTLKNRFADDGNVLFVDASKSTGFLCNAFRPIKLLFEIFFSGLKSRGGSVLMFSSAYSSFWEKLAWCFICRLLGLRTIIQTVDGNFPRYYKELSPPSRWLASVLIKNVNILAAQSNQWRMFYQNIFPNTKVKVVSPGIDTGFFKPSENHKEDKCVEVVYIGWLIEDKGIFDLLKATKIAVDNGLLFKLRLIGPDYGNKKAIQKYINEYDLNNIIEVPGEITSREKILEAYQSADIFVFPSHFEGFPYALMEAISTGLPCIGTRVGGIPDILDDGNCGLLIDKKSPEQLADALRKLIDDEKYRQLLSICSRERAIAEYSLSKSFSDFKRVLKVDG